ncbi:MAG: Rrf2 family transcriptional regulator [Phycisphaerales bacterium]
MISRTTEYALRAMVCIAMRPDEHFSASTLSTLTAVPQDYLAKVLQQLSTAGFISGRRGVGGGYTLDKPPSEVRLIDIINAVSSLQRITTCPLGLDTHGPNLCPLHQTIDKAIAAALSVLNGVTLADLLEKHPRANAPLCNAQLLATPTISTRARS